ncbi:TerC/Alx family metal homeostasis membrane protein [Melioribacteraceae bacterium 4301-Me]|uniref:TerC/Alx family metal homeostasis membrane protein n=1 Tax=Pyranulibacter aquaticus TaxID=3163344 RepID=UPI00359BC483
MLDNEIFWGIFIITIAIMFYIDLYATEHRIGKIGIKVSLIWSGIWIITALLFNILILILHDDGKQKAIEFLAGYLIEKSLSVDNLFVFLMIFNVMNIKDEFQPHVLKWGILSAIIMRIVFILAGVTLIKIFHPIIYIFGLLLFYAAYKMLLGKQEKIDLDNNKIIKFVSKRFHIQTNYEGKYFFTKIDGKKYVTTLFLTFLLIESADLIFAIDSIPAVIAITRDPFIVITSNIFAVLGLRALYFAIAGIVQMFTYLKYGVGIILAYVGIKMMISDFYKIPTLISLSIIIACLFLSIIISLIQRKASSSEKLKQINEK